MAILHHVFNRRSAGRDDLADALAISRACWPSTAFLRLGDRYHQLGPAAQGLERRRRARSGNITSRAMSEPLVLGHHAAARLRKRWRFEKG